MSLSFKFRVNNHPKTDPEAIGGAGFLQGPAATFHKKIVGAGIKPAPAFAQNSKLRMNGHYRTKGPGHHLIGHAAEEDPLQALAAVGAHDDEINVLLFGQLQDLFRR